VAYQGLLHDPQRALHARIAEAIERLAPERVAEQTERLAHHALRGGRPNGRDRAAGKHVKRAARLLSPSGGLLS
jgi:predicted ATPase